MGGRLPFGVKCVVAFAVFQAVGAVITSLLFIDVSSDNGSAGDAASSFTGPTLVFALLWLVAAIGLIQRRGWARWVVIGLLCVVNPLTAALIPPRETTALGVVIPQLLGWLVYAPATAVYLLMSKPFSEPDVGLDHVPVRLGPANLFIASLAVLGTGVVTAAASFLAGFVPMDRPGGADALVWTVAYGSLASLLVGAAMMVATLSWAIWRAILRR